MHTLRFINKDIFTGLAQEAVLTAIQKGQPVPKTLDEAEELLLTVMSETELNRLGKIPGIDEAINRLTMWMMTDDITREWFSGCELAQILEEARRNACFG
jgi:hypothetical protein